MAGKSRYLKKKQTDRSVYELALERIHHTYDLFDSISVFFSGGKDSTACLNLALAVARERNRLPLRVAFFDEEAIPYQTEEYVRRVSQLPDVALEWYALPVQHRNACSPSEPYWSPWDPTCRDLWVREMPPEAITEISGFSWTGAPRTQMTIPEVKGLLHDPRMYGSCAVIMGIRAQESLIRTRAVMGRKTENYLIHWDKKPSKGNIHKCYAIYDWGTDDVWTAPRLFHWDYNHAYDVMEAAGVPRLQQRCSPAYGEEPLQRFFTYKTCFPEIWDRMSERVAGANTAMLYSRTELYGFGSLPPKSPGETWEECLLRSVTRFARDDQPLVAKRLKQAIGEHYRKTSDPILASVPHPQSGVSWERLYSIAIRGDFKNRRTSTLINNTGASHGKGWDRAWEEYHAARKAEEEVR